MDFLALVNRARRECGVTGAALSTLTDADLTTESLRFKTWVNQAWRDLQSTRADWTWMRASVSFQTVAGQASYTPTQAGASTALHWFPDTFRIYLTASGVNDEQYLSAMDYEWYRDMYLFGPNRTAQGRPTIIAITPANSIALAAVPDAVYTVVGDYQAAAADMSATTDTPTGLPEHFHMLIVWGAMKAFASFEAAPEQYERAAREERRMMNKLYMYGLPPLQYGPPLA